MKSGDEIQITYKRDQTMIIEIVQGKFEREDKDWIYLEGDRKYRISKIKGLRNLTKEKSPPEILSD